MMEKYYGSAVNLTDAENFLLWSHGTWASHQLVRHKSRPAVASRYLADRLAGDWPRLADSRQNRAPRSQSWARRDRKAARCRCRPRNCHAS